MFVSNAIAYSPSCLTYTGAGNVNVVGVSAVVSGMISAACLTTLPKGKTLLLGYPFTVALISKVTGIFSSFAEKKMSTDVKKQPPETSSAAPAPVVDPLSDGVTVNVIANGSPSPSSPSSAKATAAAL